jgi:hypothetical protein
MTDLSNDPAPLDRHDDKSTPTAGHSGEGINSADHVENKDLDSLKGKERQDALLDEAVDETFPASDPVSVKRIT